MFFLIGALDVGNLLLEIVIFSLLNTALFMISKPQSREVAYNVPTRLLFFILALKKSVVN